MRPKIWVDCDGLLCDFVRGYLDVLHAEHGVYRTHADVVQWDLGMLSAKETNLAVLERMIVTGGVSALPMIAGAFDGLDALRRLGEVGCLTSPLYLGTFVQQRYQWLKACGFTKRDIIFADDKKWVSGAVLIDDKIENCLEWQAENPYGLAILFDQPWNQSDNDDLVRAHGWGETVALVVRWLASPHFEQR
jgi:5'(3')-deoxyribonucleotidase